MSHSMSAIWVHAFFGIRDDQSGIDPDIAQKLFAHMCSSVEQDYPCQRSRY